MRLVECVPNFSEGRDRTVIDAIAGAIDAVDGVRLLDVDPGADTHRTVMTFVGPPEAAADAAFAAIATAARRIDMRRHHGEHPRMGATDVCPFVPVEGVTMDECAGLARDLGRRVGDELGIPVYLYGAAATTPERSSLAAVRAGEYEGLASRTDAPDFGPGSFNATAGATAIGARPFLIAYNVDLDTRDRAAAHRIAQAIRELGAPEREEDGTIRRDASGAIVYRPGRFAQCRAVGWYIAEYGRAQVSINLTDPSVTSLADVFEGCVEEAAALGLRVTGSEIVGLVPRAALLAAGDHFLAKQGRTTGVPEAERIHAAVLSLGLSDVAPFDPAAKVLEYRYGGDGPLVAGTVRSFVDSVSSDSPTPGGGSVAALCGALGSALCAMVAALSFAKADPEGRDRAGDVGRRAQAGKDWFLAAVDRDASAYDGVLAARRLPRTTPEETTRREAAIAAANLEAARVPLEVLERAVAALELAVEAATIAPAAVSSDAGVAAACALAAAEGAARNVAINLPGLDEATAASLEERRAALVARGREVHAAVVATLDAGAP